MNDEMKDGIDALAMTLARNAFEAGAPLELWASLVCEARGMEHRLPRSRSELVAACLTDIYETRDALDTAGVVAPTLPALNNRAVA